MSFKNEEGADFGGLTKEMFTLFWKGAYELYFIGENAKVPFIPLHRSRREAQVYKSIGRVLTHMVALTQTVPFMLAKSCYISMVFNESADDECLLSDLFKFVTEAE